MPHLLKPSVLEDVKAPHVSSFRIIEPRLNLGYERTVRINLTRATRLLIVIWVMVSFVFGLAAAPTIHISAATTTAEERTALETQLQQLEKQIDEYEDQIVGYQKQGKNLKNEINTLNSKISKLNLQIKAINYNLAQLDTRIVETQNKIVETEGDINTNKRALGSLLKNLYESERASMVEIFLKNPRLSDFVNDLNNLELLQKQVQFTIAEITDQKNQLEEQKTSYALARADAATLKAYQESQRQETDQIKKQKDNLLAVTKGQESKYQELLKTTKETAAKIRSRIFQLLGGGELTFEQAYEYAKLASSATGVRSAMILAVLDRESALGKNVGRCSYETAMNPKDRPVFLKILEELGLNVGSVTVSCPNSDGVYGGAMGPAQFIPSTWMLYRDAVAKTTGHNPPSPWNNADAFVATALYLKDAGAANASVADERKAAARYYAGSRWSRYLWTYGEAVVSRARQFQEDIDILNS